MTLEVKMRLLAQQDAALAGIFFSNGKMRWFDRQLGQGYLSTGTCARVLRVSTVRPYSHETTTQRGVSSVVQARMQIDVLDTDPERARSAAAAIRDWLDTCDFTSNNQFGSPTLSATKHPNFILNQRAGMEPQAKPPVYVESLDVRIFDLEE